MKTIPYPRIPASKDKRRKLSEKQVEDIRRLRLAGWSQEKLGIKFGVNRGTIRYWTDEQYRIQTNKKRYADMKKRENADPDFKKARNIYKREHFKSRAKREPQVRKYRRNRTKQWRGKRRKRDDNYRKKDNRKIYLRERRRFARHCLGKCWCGKAHKKLPLINRRLSQESLNL